MNELSKIEAREISVLVNALPQEYSIEKLNNKDTKEKLNLKCSSKITEVKHFNKE